MKTCIDQSLIGCSVIMELPYYHLLMSMLLGVAYSILFFIINSDDNKKQDNYKNVVVVGSTTSEESGYLLPKAEKTFLKKESKCTHLSV